MLVGTKGLSGTLLTAVDGYAVLNNHGVPGGAEERVQNILSNR